MTKGEKEFEEGLERVKKYHAVTKDLFGKVLKDASEANLTFAGPLAGNIVKHILQAQEQTAPGTKVV
ncbi:hypothetical protein [Pseudomonas serbica]|uniref:hypothetical protein n=1 Tax=Pseudomonas serbica TaxID=2965074 RepID=UPI00237B2DA7|nr:hypothetical protein [Pseudomonas serbica]